MRLIIAEIRTGTYLTPLRLSSVAPGNSEAGKAGKRGIGDALLLDENLEALSHALGENQSFQLQAGTRTRSASSMSSS